VTHTNDEMPRRDCPDLASRLPVELFKALSDPTRVAMLAGLAAGGTTQTVSEVAGRSPVDVSVVPRHLEIMQRAGLLGSEKRGREACCPDGTCIISHTGVGEVAS
jgi:DNA-binding transcriptional ArsR family regulator